MGNHLKLFLLSFYFYGDGFCQLKPVGFVLTGGWSDALKRVLLEALLACPKRHDAEVPTDLLLLVR